MGISSPNHVRKLTSPDEPTRADAYIGKGSRHANSGGGTFLRLVAPPFSESPAKATSGRRRAQKINAGAQKINAATPEAILLRYIMSISMGVTGARTNPGTADDRVRLRLAGAASEVHRRRCSHPGRRDRVATIRFSIGIPRRCAGT